MELVDSVLAFALVMAALASVVTMMMEVFHRVFNLRAKGMEALFNQFYDDVLAEKLNITKAEKEDIRKKVLTNPARAIILSSSHKVFPNWVIEKLMCSTEMSHDELLKRLHQAKAFVHLKGESKSSIKHKLEIIKSKLLAGSQQVMKLSSLGIPVGWNYFPVRTGNETKSAHGLVSIRNNLGAYLSWFFKVLMTGLLIGLGAPFWFEIAQKLTKIKSGLKGRGATKITEDHISKSK